MAGVAVVEFLVELIAGSCVGACMGLVGAGGAVFTVPIFGVLLGHEPKASILEALAVTGGIAAFTALLAARRRSVDARRAVILSVAGIAGTQVAAPVAVRMPGSVQVAMFVALALAVAGRMWASGEPAAAPPATGRRTAAGTAAVGFAVGMLTSILGVGGGFMLTPALVLWERLPMPRAVGTSLAVITVNAAAGLAGQWWYGAFEQVAFDGRAVAVTAAFGAAGSVIGARIAGRLPQRTVRRTFAVLLAAAGAALAVQSLAN